MLYLQCECKKIVFSFYFLANIFLMLLLFSTPSHSITLNFITINVPPWAYQSENKSELAGIFPDLVKEIERRTGFSIKVTLASFSFSRINRELEAGRQDCTAVITERERGELVVLGEVILYHPMGVIPYKGIHIRKYEDLYDLRISVHPALAAEGKFMDDFKLIKELDASYEAGLRKVQHRRVNAVAGAISTLQYLAHKQGIANLLGEPFFLYQEPIHLQCAKNSKKIRYLNELNKAIKEIKSDLTLDKIINANLER
jgi:polar amino acid transport system substrate-binding protein